MIIDISLIEKALEKLKRKDPAMFRVVQKKIGQIGTCDEVSILHFKNLTGDMSSMRRAHVGSFVLCFRIQGNTIIFERFRHHDEAYKR